MASNRDSLRNPLKYLGTTFALVWRSNPKATGLLSLSALVLAILPIVIAWIARDIIDAVTAHQTQRALQWVFIELGCVGLQFVAQRSLVLLRTNIALRLSLDINVMILKKALTLKLADFEDADFYDRLSRARREAAFRPVAVVTETFELLQNGGTLLSYLFVILHLGGGYALALLASLLPALISETVFSDRVFRLRNSWAPHARVLNYLESLLATDTHAKEVKIFGIGQYLLDQHIAEGDRFYREEAKLSGRRATWATALLLLGTVSYYGCYAAIAVATATGRMSVGDMTLYVLAFRQSQQSFQVVLTAVGGMYENNLFLSNLFEYLERPSAAATRALPAGDTQADRRIVAAGADEGLRFEGVGFRYSPQHPWILQGINLHLRPRQSVAVVGQNGAGKTTLVKLMLRLHPPTAGRILLDGRDLQCWSEEELHRRFSVVFQDFNRYQFSLRENVGVGDVRHMHDDEKVQTALRLAEVDFLDHDSLEQRLGRWFPGGIELSGGQWQSVALARAFLRESADIIILDEPTSALDAESEEAVFERLQILGKGRLSIIVSHRLARVRGADRILVLENGVLTEDGHHSQLMGNGKLYAKLFAMQAAKYS